MVGRREFSGVRGGVDGCVERASSSPEVVAGAADFSGFKNTGTAMAAARY